MPGSWRSSGGRTGAGRQAAPGAAGGAVAGAAGRAVLPHKDHDPRDYGFVAHRWTRDLVADLVEEVFGVRFTPQWTGTLLRRLGLSCSVRPTGPARRMRRRWPPGDSRPIRRSGPRPPRPVPPSTSATRWGWRPATMPAPPGRRPAGLRW